MTGRERSSDFRVVASADVGTWAAVLEEQVQLLLQAETQTRPWMFWELHNPWSRAATRIDSWQVLDICQASSMVDLLVEHIGDDIILFDSQVLPNPTLAPAPGNEWQSDAVFFPLDEPGGVVVRLPFGSIRPRKIEFGGAAAETVELAPGELLIHAADAPFRYRNPGHSPGYEFVIRYFPANLRYLRAPDHPLHEKLTSLFPWVNYATMPLWLVRGTDRADNDFATGFFRKVGRWTTARAAD